ncbi:MAG: hypothetical protein ACC628_11685 [Pirellulaceae bacterium]
MTRAKASDAGPLPWSAEMADAAVPPHRGLPAWFASLVLHATILVAAGLLIQASPPRSPTVAERMVGIALVQKTESRARYFSESQSASNRSSAPPTARSHSEPFPHIEEMPLPQAASLPSLDELGALAGPGLELPSAKGLIAGSRPARRVGGGGTSTQVFGAQATGSKFVYVFDRSASMEGFQGRPMRAAKTELAASLRDLESVHQFQIIFYNEKVSVFNPSRPQKPHMMFGTESNVRLAEAYIRSIGPAGGTRHMEPIRLALGLQPDVIFLLTDAEEPSLTPSELAEIRRYNRADTSILAIEFGSGPFRGGENFLMRLARQNHGEHVYVDVSRLGVKEG